MWLFRDHFWSFPLDCPWTVRPESPADKLSGRKMTGIVTGQWPDKNPHFHQKNLDSGDTGVRYCPAGVRPEKVGECKDLATVDTLKKSSRGSYINTFF